MHSSVSVLQSAIQLAVQEVEKKITEGEYGEKVRSKDSLRVFLCLLFLCDLLYSLLVETEDSIMACWFLLLIM